MLSIGVDLGTTNSAVAWVDAGAGPEAQPRLSDILQLVAAGEVAARATLPSFLYLTTAEERESGAVALPWAAAPDMVAGTYARDHGALVPTRQVSSAKSWLSNPAVDRRAALLPWTADAGRISPVEASARLLIHLRDAWNHARSHDVPEPPLQEHPIVLTVPASFDEEARELTVEAARQAGFAHLTLIEEPIAAVYAWLASHPRDQPHALGDGQLLLVCDVGGGTTDFSMIRGRSVAGQVELERIAIGEHLLLGGDNMDVALAALLERRLAEASPETRLDLTQRYMLRRRCSAAKEQLLGPAPPHQVAITLLGSGRAVVGGAIRMVLTREDVQSTLDRFLPLGARDDRPQRHRREGLRELGLPYESDPAITRHLAAFLARAARVAAESSSQALSGDMLRPDAVLFNGGFFTPALARERILRALAAWFGAEPAVLANPAPEAAVAVGAAYYGALRQASDTARLLVRAGSPRSYYVTLDAGDGREATVAVCVLRRGTPEGTRVALDREFTVIANQPAAFTLLSSPERDDEPNAIVTFPAAAAGGADGDDPHRHAPLITALRYGRRSRRVPLTVRLNLFYTEVGTIELWCESATTDHRWRLQFNVRAVEQREFTARAGQPSSSADRPGSTPHTDPPSGGELTAAGEPGALRGGSGSGASPAAEVIVPEDAIVTAEHLLRAVFQDGENGGRVQTLTGDLEAALGHGKHGWPLPVLRRLADVLLETVEGRRTSARHEARWLNLAGFCVRPGIGTSRDPWRISELRKVYAADLVHPKDVQCQVEWLVLWQRVSAGFSASQQQELATKLIGLLGFGARKAPKPNTQVAREAWRLLAGLERLDRDQRVRLGDELIPRVRREPQNSALVWALGRLGTRVPAYGPLNAVVPPAAAERWLAVLLGVRTRDPDVAAAVAEIASRTDDPARDIAEEARVSAETWLRESGAPADLVTLVRDAVALHRATPTQLYGEPLPQGLRLADPR